MASSRKLKGPHAIASIVENIDWNYCRVSMTLFADLHFDSEYRDHLPMPTAVVLLFIHAERMKQELCESQRVFVDAARRWKVRSVVVCREQMKTALQLSFVDCVQGLVHLGVFWSRKGPRYCYGGYFPESYVTTLLGFPRLRVRAIGFTRLGFRAYDIGCRSLEFSVSVAFD